MRDDVLVGEITVEEADMPWLHGRFAAGPAFLPLAPLFERELALIETIAEDYEEWERVYDQIARAVRLVAPHGPVPEFLLHIQGDQA
ncbi:hypothetical protein ETD86_51570 [Nonomuraea turkmeniaca]|uniref:Uncharacterized protein n=2 Tax=Nonomuraea turkmeniaca TaxID=103838 RepID=A0A5S4EVX0_9ACTN|nr:hypothetical protein ETD86_51570 [Nonomuraea turkmeniaca]